LPGKAAPSRKHCDAIVTLHTQMARHYTQEDTFDPYRLLSFEVPPGIARLTVRYRYVDPADPALGGKASGAVIDLGLFDPRGHDYLDAEGFRGWSGSARDEVTIAPQGATPGYLPGPIQPGTWHVLLGLYRIGHSGCEVRVEIEMVEGTACDVAPPAYRPQGTLCEERRWYRGDLHCHTHHSDGTAGVEALIAAAQAQGLDFLAVTEHNTVSHLPDLMRHAPPDLLLIPGIEITTYRGHANLWGVRGWHEFRATNDRAMRQIRERARARGHLFSVNHPKPGGPPWAFNDTFAPDAVEGWQAPWFLGNSLSLAFWEGLLRQGQRPTLVGGSDKHQGPFSGHLSAYEVGTPTTWIHAARLSESGILDGIRAGRVYVSRDPSGPRLSLTARAAGHEASMGEVLEVRREEEITFHCQVCDAPLSCLLRIVGRRGEMARVRIAGSAWDHTWTERATEDGYTRVEVIESPDAPLEGDPAALMAYALSNPIYLRIADR
jgi:hypothetical protein